MLAHEIWHTRLEHAASAYRLRDGFEGDECARDDTWHGEMAWLAWLGIRRGVTESRRHNKCKICLLTAGMHADRQASNHKAIKTRYCIIYAS